jgi:hypothetical protein
MVDCSQSPEILAHTIQAKELLGGCLSLPLLEKARNLFSDSFGFGLSSIFIR